VTSAQQRGEAQLLNKARIRVTLAVNGLLEARQTRKSKAQQAPGPLLRSEEIASYLRVRYQDKLPTPARHQEILRQIFRSLGLSSELLANSLPRQAACAS
jgi:hypothetical protein